MVPVSPSSSPVQDAPASPEAGKVIPFPTPRRFVTTRWSMVLAAGQHATPQARRALSELCGLYWHPLHAFVRRQGHPSEEAKDLVQGFFTRLLEKNALAAAHPGRGRFRSWLMASVQHYMANEWDRARAHKRGGGHVHQPLLDEHGTPLQVPAPGPTPEQVFDRCWTERLLEQVLSSLRKDYASDGRGPLFDALRKTLTGATGDEYAVIARKLGMEPGAVKTAASRLRTRYRQRLHEEVLHTVERPEDVADELTYLLGTLEGV